MTDAPAAPVEGTPAAPAAAVTPPVAPPVAEPAPPPAAIVPDWSDDWRLKIAGGDEKRAKAYDKYASPKEVADAHLSLQQQLSTGEYKKKLPDKATPEEVTAWRKENGIPESPEKYDLNMPDGLVLGEQDLEVAKNFAATMHGVNADQKTVQTALVWWTKNQQAALAGRQTEDAEYERSSQDVLRAEWGGEYRMNEAAIGNVMAGMTPELAKGYMEARLPDGRKLWDNPSFRSDMLARAKEKGFDRLVLPNNGEDPMQSVEDQLAAIAKVSREDPQRYTKDTAMQKRRQDLLNAKEILDKRKAA